MSGSISISESVALSNNLRKIIVDIAKEAGDKAAHIGGALSCVDFLAAADKFYKLSDSSSSLRSLILSKGHACLSLYSLIAYSKIVSLDKVKENFERNNSKFLGHPCRYPEIGINFSTGSLGNGLAHAIGLALYRSQNLSGNSDSDVVCIVGDGECNEGIVWECFEFISKLKMKNLLIFIDCNGWQQTQESIYSWDNYESLFNRLKTYNLDVAMVDGHNHKLLLREISSQRSVTKVILGLTTKGKGYKIFENNNNWHHGILTNQMFKDLK